MKYRLSAIALVMLAITILMSEIHFPWNLRQVQSVLESPTWTADPLEVVIIGDPHFNFASAFPWYQPVFAELAENPPDLILLVGDFVGSYPWFEPDAPAQIVPFLENLSEYAPTFAILGNHDNQLDRERWIEEFENSELKLLFNEIYEVESLSVCLRAMEDYWTHYWRPVAVPEHCRGRTLTLTHDPRGLLTENRFMETPGFAGHTHCAQIRPWGITPTWVPTDAPADMHCGVFSRGEPGLTTGGTGTSKIPLRWGKGTQPRWERVIVQASAVAE